MSIKFPVLAFCRLIYCTQSNLQMESQSLTVDIDIR